MERTLIERLEAGETGPKISAEVAVLFGWRLVDEPIGDGGILTTWYDDKDVEQFRPYFTTSLDAAVALVERVRPGWNWHVSASHVYDRKASHAQIWMGSTIDHTSVCPTPAAALVAPLLKAEGGE